jgi:hypothetical protein
MLVDRIDAPTAMVSESCSAPSHREEPRIWV